MQNVLLLVALALGALITYVDTRPTWDDTGVTAGLLFLSAAALGFLGRRRPWLFALALGLWIPILGFFRTHNYATLLALVMAFAGAYGGSSLRGWFTPTRA